MQPIWVLDSPNLLKAPTDPTRFEVKGWIAARRKVNRVGFLDQELAKLLPITITVKPEVEAMFHLQTIGFESACSFDAVRHRESLTLTFETEGKQYEIILPVHCDPLDRKQLKERKFAKIIPRLKCPHCLFENPVIIRKPLNTLINVIRSKDSEPVSLWARLLLSLLRIKPANSGLRLIKQMVFRHRGLPPPEFDYLICPECHATVLLNEKHFDFLTDSMKRNFNIVPTGNISANQYDGIALNYIHKYPKGLILDNGAGKRDKYYENVVNYEIVAYESSDVLGVAERLPFKDNTFDAVFSFAVLEHVKDPASSAREMIRVLKPGGHLYCQAPFLAPLHGYPQHYFNMTQKGLARLFEGLVETDRLEVLNFGQPIFALSWFLQYYVVGLPPEMQEAFREMKVKDLLKQGDQYLGLPFVTNLSAEVQEILACSNVLLARKPTTQAVNPDIA